jgi:CheY-like chemotaxis protein
VKKMDKKIIVAEDNKDLRETYVMFIESYVDNVSIDSVSNGADLVEKVKNENYSLIFTDNDMPPGISGLESIKQIREFDKKTPIYMISGSKSKEDATYKQKTVLECGGNGFIDKDDIMNLSKQIKEVVLKYVG